MRKCLILFSVLLILSMNGCAESKQNNEENKLKISSMTSSIGAIEGDSKEYDRQKFSYTISLYNGENNEVYIKSLDPVLNQGIKEKVEKEDNKIIVEKSISPKQTITINGEFIFNAKGLSKEEIVGLEPFIKNIKVSLDKTIDLAWSKNEEADKNGKSN